MLDENQKMFISYHDTNKENHTWEVKDKKYKYINKNIRSVDVRFSCKNQ